MDRRIMDWARDALLARIAENYANRIILKGETGVDRERILQKIAKSRRQDFEYQAALKRIDDGSFGFCQSCAAELSEKRIAARPWAVNCIVCEEAIEAESLRKVPKVPDFSFGVVL